MRQEPFVIPTSLIGPTEGISSEAVRRAVKRLVDTDQIEVERSPTGRTRLNIAGYKRVRDFIRSAA